MRILIVDDDDIALAVLERTLAGAGHQVVTACNGRDALDRLQSGACRLVICDWAMPQMDGPELCRQIRRREFPGYIYVILLTAHRGTEYLVEGLSAGADEFLTKPIDEPELLIRVRTAERIISLETRDVAIFAMAKLAESRDPETGEHLERIRSYAKILAERLARDPECTEPVPQEFPRLIFMTSPLHDIGKVGLPDSVLLKPGRLSDREFEIMKMHTVIGGDTLDAACRQYPGVTYLRLARDIARTHHERWDGTGYPDGLAGKNIPLAGRIVALADVYDALTTKRVYKPAFPHEVARSVILQDSGSHFDPDVVRAFLAAEDEFITVCERFSERRDDGAPRWLSGASPVNAELVHSEA